MNRVTQSTKSASESPCCPSGTRADIHGDTAVEDGAGSGRTFALTISGMHCGSCAERIRQALIQQKGVFAAQVQLDESTARVRFDPESTDIDRLIAVVTAAGYQAAPAGRAAAPIPDRRPINIGKKPIMIGLATALGIIGFYLALLTLTSGWSYASVQFEAYRWWVLALAAGLGVQAGLFTTLRAHAAGARLRGAGSSMAASGGMSTISMALCCSHYVAAFLPAIGLPFLSAAAAGLAQYQVQFFALGVLSNLLGIGYMLRLRVKSGLKFSHRVHQPA